MSELGEDVKISALWRMSTLLGICQTRVDETGENYDNLKREED